MLALQSKCRQTKITIVDIIIVTRLMQQIAKVTGVLDL